MIDAFIYDHVRTPRGRGRPDGSLHEISSVQLAQQVLRALAERSERAARLLLRHRATTLARCAEKFLRVLPQVIDRVAGVILNEKVHARGLPDARDRRR